MMVRDTMYNRIDELQARYEALLQDDDLTADYFERLERVRLECDRLLKKIDTYSDEELLKELEETKIGVEE